MITVNCFAVHAWDGGERHNFAYRINANNTTKKQLEESLKHSMIIPETIIVFDSMEEQRENTPNKIRERAIAKLSPIELQVLGIKV